MSHALGRASLATLRPIQRKICCAAGRTYASVLSMRSRLSGADPTSVNVAESLTADACSGQG